MVANLQEVVGAPHVSLEGGSAGEVASPEGVRLLGDGEEIILLCGPCLARTVHVVRVA